MFLGLFYTFLLYIFISLTLFFACNSAFEQGHLEPWRYINAFIIIIIMVGDDDEPENDRQDLSDSEDE